MKRAYRFGLVGVWVVLATVFLARWWLINPDMFPTLPESLWKWLSQLYGANCCEEQADLELFVSLGVSFFLISLLTFIALVLWRRIQKR